MALRRDRTDRTDGSDGWGWDHRHTHSARVHVRKCLEDLAMGLPMHEHEHEHEDEDEDEDDARIAQIAQHSTLAVSLLPRVLTRCCLVPENLTALVMRLQPKPHVVHVLKALVDEEPDVAELRAVKRWARRMIAVIMAEQVEEPTVAAATATAAPAMRKDPTPVEVIHRGRPFHGQIKRVVWCAQRLIEDRTTFSIAQFRESLKAFDFDLFPRELEVVLAILARRSQPLKQQLHAILDGHYEKIEGIQIGTLGVLQVGMCSTTPDHHAAVEEMHKCVQACFGTEMQIENGHLNGNGNRNSNGTGKALPFIEEQLAGYSAGLIQFLLYDLLNLCIYIPEHSIYSCFVTLKSTLHSKAVMQNGIAVNYFCTKILQCMLSFLAGGDIASFVRLLIALLVVDISRGNDLYECAWRERMPELDKIANELKSCEDFQNTGESELSNLASLFVSKYCTL